MCEALEREFDAQGRPAQGLFPYWKSAFEAGWQSALSQPAPQGAAEVMRLVDRLTSEVNGLHHTPNGNKDGAYERCETVRGELEQAVTALMQERDDLRNDNRLLHSGMLDLANRIIELELDGDDLRDRVAELEQDAARYKFLRHCDALRLHQLVEVDGFEKFDKTIDSAIAAAKEPK